MAFLPLSPLVLGALAIGLLVVAPFCVLMWRAGYNVAWASLPFAAALLLNLPTVARPSSVIIVAAVYLLGLYAFVLSTGQAQRRRRLALRRQKGSKTWQPLAALTARPAMANRATAGVTPRTAGTPMLLLPNGTVRPAPWAPRVPAS